MIPPKICPHCKSQVSPAARFCSSCGRPVADSDSEQTILSQRRPVKPVNSPPAPPPTPSPSPQKRGQPWLPVLAITLAVICCLGAFGVGRWFLREGWTLSGSATTPPAELNLETLVSETLQPSNQPQTVTWSNQVTVTIPGGLLPSERTLTISAVPDAPPPLAADIYRPGAVFDISLGDMTRFAQPLTIELAYDPAKLSPDIPAADQLALAYWAPQAQEWSFIPVQVDEPRQVAIIQIDHLTTMGWYYINVEDYAVKTVSPQFRVIYNPDLSAAIKVPGEAGLKAGIDNFAGYTGQALEQAFSRYKAAGFRLPDDRIDVIIGDWSSSSATPSAGVIYIVYNADYPEMAFDGAHELFHLVQYQYLDAEEMAGVRWWVEASADYAAGRIAWAGQPDTEKRMGSGIKLNYMDQSIEYLSEDTDDPYFRHQYHTAHLLEFLLAGKSGGQTPDKTFSDMWSYVTGKINEHDDPLLMVEEEDIAHDLDVTLHLTEWLGGRSRMEAAYREFAGYLLFNAGSPLPITETKVPAEAAAQWSYLKLNDTETTSQSFFLPARYSARLWGVVVEVDPAEASRLVSVSGAGSWPQDVTAHIFSLPGDVRANLGYGQTPPPLASYSGGQPVQVNASPGAGLYVLVMNAGDQSQQVSLKIAAEDKEPTVTPSDTVWGKWVLIDKIVEPPDFSSWTGCPIQSNFTAVSASLTWPQQACTCPVVTFTHAWPELPDQLESGQSIPIEMRAHWTVAPGCDPKDYVGVRTIINFTQHWQGYNIEAKQINNGGQTHQPPAAPLVETATLMGLPHPAIFYYKSPSPGDTFEAVFTISTGFANEFQGRVKYIYTFKAEAP